MCSTSRRRTPSSTAAGRKASAKPSCATSDANRGGRRRRGLQDLQGPLDSISGTLAGRRLEDVGEMLIESNPLLGAASFGREREVRKHVGDYTLFLTGLFPEHLKR